MLLKELLLKRVELKNCISNMEFVNERLMRFIVDIVICVTSVNV